MHLSTGLPLVAPLGRSLFAWQPGTWQHRASLCVAGMALGDIDHHFVWQTWHLETWTCTLHGRRGTYGTGLALVARLLAP